MLTSKESLKATINSNDDDLINKIITIKETSKDHHEFKRKVQALKSGLDDILILKVYGLLSKSARESSNKESDVRNALILDSDVKSNIAQTLKEDLGLQDETVVNFIYDILQETKSKERFRKKLMEMDSGLLDSTIDKIYNSATFLSTKEYSRRSDGRARPNVHVPASIQAEGKCHTTKNASRHDTNMRNKSDVKLPILNQTYKGKVVNVTSFGCFVELDSYPNGPHGLVHISEVSDTPVHKIQNILKVGRSVYVRVIKIFSDGKISLTMRGIDQKNGSKLQNFETFEDRGRSSKPTEIRSRNLTSPERWEIGQLIASGAASIEDFPELNNNNIDISNPSNLSDANYTGADNKRKVDSNIEEVDVEINVSGKPDFLRTQTKKDIKNYDVPVLSKIPNGTLSKVAMTGSTVLKQHRDQKYEKKREIEKQIRELLQTDDPSKLSSAVKQQLEFLRKQLYVTAWERNKHSERIKLGKHATDSIEHQRKSLPVHRMQQIIIETVRKNQFVVIVGETGSGKTTQITQYLDDAGFSDSGMIGCTQPRRVAAVSVAKRVSEEMGCKVGEDVGYTIRFEDATSSRTRIKYMTEGMLQRETLLDAEMSKYSVIMLDEAHERTVATDVLFGLLKKAAKDRPELRVIVTSATLDAKKFSEFFNQCPILSIPGKTYPVDIHYADTPQMDYIEAALDTVIDIHVNEDPGDILVFLTGQDEIDSCCEMLYERVKNLGDSIGELIILPIYSALPSEVQSKIFEPTPEGKRKVVFATNIAETSITIDGIYYVVDPGYSKINTYNARVGIEQLTVSPISQAQANQRKGRAGRTGPGKCYRLYTEHAFNTEMLPNTVPEIQRQNLTHTVLMLKAMGIDDLINFEFMDPPPQALLIRALEVLYHLEALDTDGNLSQLGNKMSLFPMDPGLARSLLISVQYGCSDEIVTIISMLSVQNVFYRPRDKQRLADMKKSAFFHPYGDHLTLLNVYKKWKKSSYSEKYCQLNYLHYRHLKRAKDVRSQILKIFDDMNLPLKSSNNDPDLIRKSLVAGFFMNAAKRDSEMGYKTIAGDTNVSIHPSSSLSGREYEYVIYHSITLTSREYMSTVTAIESPWLLELAPHFYKLSEGISSAAKKAKITPLYNKFAKDQNSWRLSSLKKTRDRALGIKR